MVKLWIIAPNDGTPPLYAFLDALEEKQRQKIFSLLALLLQTPEAAMREPYVKHFGIERYRALYELRAKSRNLVRITFTLMENGDVLFLIPFIKRHRRDTMQALDASLRLLSQCKDGSCSVQELSIKSYVNGGNAT